MPKKDYSLNLQKQIVHVQVSELQHLPDNRQVFKSMGSILMPAERDELLDELMDKEQELEAQSYTLKK